MQTLSLDISLSGGNRFGTMSPSLCPCGSDLIRPACCGPFLDGREHPPTALALMRSRYSAHVEARVDYLVETVAPESRATYAASGVRQMIEMVQWLGRSILGTSGGGPRDDEGTVTFEARFNAEGRDQGMWERSLFRRVDGRWAYVSGEVPSHGTRPVRRASPKVGRNDPCPCGSGRKFKKCCG